MRLRTSSEQSGDVFSYSNDRRDKMNASIIGLVNQKGGTGNTVSLLKPRLMCYNISGDENEEIRDNH